MKKNKPNYVLLTCWNCKNKPSLPGEAKLWVQVLHGQKPVVHYTCKCGQKLQIIISRNAAHKMIHRLSAKAKVMLIDRGDLQPADPPIENCPRCDYLNRFMLLPHWTWITLLSDGWSRWDTLCDEGHETEHWFDPEKTMLHTGPQGSFERCMVQLPVM